MREVKYTTRFQRDYKREKSGRHSKKLDGLLMEVINTLAADMPLPRRNFDHPLSGDGTIIVIATLSLIWFSSIASPTTTASNLCALGRIVSLGCDSSGKFPCSNTHSLNENRGKRRSTTLALLCETERRLSPIHARKRKALLLRPPPAGAA